MSWPEHLWRSPWLRRIDAVGREEIEAAGELRSLERGARLFSTGDPADSFFVVEHGVVEVGDGRPVESRSGQREAIRLVVGDVLGDEGFARRAGRRRGHATCVTSVRVAEIPVAIFERVGERSGAAPWTDRRDALLREAALEALRTSDLARLLPAGELDALARATESRELARGEALFERGDPARRAYVLAEGMLVVEEWLEGRVRPRAHLAPGALLGGPSLLTGGAYDVTARASGPAWVLEVPRDVLLHVGPPQAARLAEALRWPRDRALDAGATRHVGADLWRFAVASSLLVIDDETCVRCGHCVWTCASTHEGGVARLDRRGDKVVVRDAGDGTRRAILLPGSCQHCQHPACMAECPTGAIGRSPSGEVQIREALCVGCGQCERACPWGTIHMAPRPDVPRGLRLPLAPSARVAVKCDACEGATGGAACVRGCPVGAIARVEPAAAIADVRDAVGRRPTRSGLPRLAPAWPWVVAALPPSAVLALRGLRAGPWATGAGAAILLGIVAGYGVWKRLVLPRRELRVTARPAYVTHLALSVLALGAVLAHAGSRVPANVGGALLVGFVVASAAGAAAALGYALLPRLLSRVEREGRLPADLLDRARDLEERTFGVLSGRSDATKATFQRHLVPYVRAPLGGLRLLLTRRTLSEEEASVRRRIRRVDGSGARCDGLDDLVRLSVERRAVGAQRILQGFLRGAPAVHAILAAGVLVLLAAHVLLAGLGR